MVNIRMGSIPYSQEDDARNLFKTCGKVVFRGNGGADANRFRGAASAYVG
jgi:hypothetical protein